MTKISSTSKIPLVIAAIVFMTVLAAALMWAAHLSHAQEGQQAWAIKARPPTHSTVLPLTEDEARMRHNAIGKEIESFNHPAEAIAFAKEFLLTLPERPEVLFPNFNGETLRAFGAMAENVGRRDSCGYPPKSYFADRLGVASFWVYNAQDVEAALLRWATIYPERTSEGGQSRFLLRSIRARSAELQHEAKLSKWFADENMIYPPCPPTVSPEPTFDISIPWPSDAAIERIWSALVSGAELSPSAKKTGADSAYCFPYWMVHAASRVLSWDVIELSAKADRPDAYRDQVSSTIQPKLTTAYRRAIQAECLSGNPNSGALGEQSPAVHQILATLGGAVTTNRLSQMIAQWFLQEAHNE